MLHQQSSRFLKYSFSTQISKSIVLKYQTYTRCPSTPDALYTFRLKSKDGENTITDHLVLILTATTLLLR